MVNLTNAPEKPINLGNPNENTMLNLANLIISLTNSRSEIIFTKLPNDDPRQRKPDITKAQTALDWYPKIQIMEGLDETIKYFKKII
jgi:UDP-glucuronate decarboxylase